MKKLILTMLALCVCLTLTGCTHEHILESMWSISPDGHWHACEKCDDQTDFAAHSFDANGNCTVCTAAFYDTQEGTKEAKTFDDHDSLVLHIQYDTKGKILSDERYAYEYDSNGKVKNQKYYKDRVLAHEDVYLPCTDPQNGETYKSKSIDYYTDVYTIINEYSEKGYLLLTTTFDANGKLYSTVRYDYEFDADGNRTKLSIYTDDVLCRVFDDVNHKLYDYDANGLVKTERTYVYDADGQLVKEIVYLYDRIDLENYYTTTEDGTQYVYKMVFYDEEGNIKQESLYDENGKIIG